LKYCKCPCGGTIECKPRPSYLGIPDYLPGHGNKGKKLLNLSNAKKKWYQTPAGLEDREKRREKAKEFRKTVWKPKRNRVKELKVVQRKLTGIKFRDDTICRICGKEYLSLCGRTEHVSKIHKLSVKEYYDRFYKQPGEGICKRSGCCKESCFSLNGYGNYCSISCGVTGTIEKRKETCLERYINKLGR